MCVMIQKEINFIYILSAKSLKCGVFIRFLLKINQTHIYIRTKLSYAIITKRECDIFALTPVT